MTSLRRLSTVTLLVQAAVLAGCLAAGLYAALAGGAAERLGDGPGGLGGLPALGLLGLGALLGLASAVQERRRPGRAALVLAGPLLVGLGYFFFAHAVDPCALGVWDASSSVGGAPLCETTVHGVAMDARFHLLEHALAASLLLAGWARLLRGPAGGPAPEAARLDRAPRRLSSVGRAPHS